MKHFLATRFNIRLEGWDTTKNNAPLNTDQWLKQRFYLFENYCLPSVKNQTCQNFRWFLFFDVNTPSFYRNRIQYLVHLYPHIRPIYVEKFATIEEMQYPLINNIKRLVSKEEYIITTTLDNDDLLHKDFITTLQQLYRPVNKTVIDLINGYQVTLNPCQVRLSQNHFNPFVSVVEHIDDLETVFSKKHFDWQQSDKVISFDKKRLWVELVHTHNKNNDTREGLEKINSINSRNFGLSPYQFHTKSMK